MKLRHAQSADDCRTAIVIGKGIAVVTVGRRVVAQLDVAVAKQRQRLGIGLLVGGDTVQNALCIAGLAHGQQGLAQHLACLHIAPIDVDEHRQQLERGLELFALERDGPEQQQIGGSVPQIGCGIETDDVAGDCAHLVGLLRAAHGAQCLGLQVGYRRDRGILVAQGFEQRRGHPRLSSLEQGGGLAERRLQVFRIEPVSA